MRIITQKKKKHSFEMISAVDAGSISNEVKTRIKELIVNLTS